MIAEKVAAALSLDPRWKAEVDADALVRDLESQFSIWIGRPHSLDDPTGHLAWLLQKKSSIRWQYWERYREMLKETWPPASVDRLDEITDEVLMRLEDPDRAGPWDRRGLVVGHVQSGKTANYIGLINKAVDAGYQLVVVLAGIHKSLRSQTQIRLDEGFLGYESVAAGANQGVKAIGVGRISPGLKANTITNRSDGGDFKRATAEQFQIHPGGKPLLFVIKKNASVLKNLLDWVEWVAGEPVDGRRRIPDVPLLVIDDEADNASVDTKQQAFNEDKEPDPEHDPTMINRRIRRLLNCFEKAAYVGYTATPFANIFIHEQGRTRDEGDDLFPRSFIVSLPAPSNYVSPLRVFGMAADSESSPPSATGLPIVRKICDHGPLGDAEEDTGTGWMPSRHNKEHRPMSDGVPELPPTLQDAILSFLLACAARKLRGQAPAHNSMLIHVTRFTAVQELVFEQVSQFMEQVRNRLQWGEGQAPSPLVKRLRAIWEEDFLPTSAAMVAPAHGWDDVASVLWAEASAITVRRINGTAPDILDYDSHKASGLSVIAIGGDKLARGLTLEGLTVSYFLRATKMYDTLMQMGRWFGYRPGYLDLCRMYMTDELKDWFEHITAASEELRQEFERMVAVGGTPRDYGLKVKTHSSLLITARVKMRNGADVDLSFAGDISETNVFLTDERSLRNNLEAASHLIGVLGANNGEEPRQDRPEGRDTWEGSRVWTKVPAAHVAAFLRSVITHERAYKVQAKVMADYVDREALAGAMTDWTVAILGKKDGARCTVGSLEFRLIERAGTVQGSPPGLTVDSRLLSPRDEALDLNSEEWARALQLTRDNWTPDAARSRGKEPKAPEIPVGRWIRSVRPRSRGLMLIYMLREKSETHIAYGTAPLPCPLVGFAVSFPDSDTKVTVKYRVNNVYWQQEFGAPDL